MHAFCLSRVHPTYFMTWSLQSCSPSHLKAPTHTVAPLLLHIPPPHLHTPTPTPPPHPTPHLNPHSSSPTPTPPPCSQVQLRGGAPPARSCVAAGGRLCGRGAGVQQGPGDRPPPLQVIFQQGLLVRQGREGAGSCMVVAHVDAWWPATMGVSPSHHESVAGPCVSLSSFAKGCVGG